MSTQTLARDGLMRTVSISLDEVRRLAASKFQSNAYLLSLINNTHANYLRVGGEAYYGKDVILCLHNLLSGTQTL